MPQALAIDHERVRIVALQIGVREAARQFGLNEDTVSGWSAREGWFRELEKQTQFASSFHAAKAKRQGITKAVETTPQDVLANYAGPTRLNHARAAHKISEKIAEIADSAPDAALIRIPEILAAAKHASVTHNWQTASVNVGIRLDQIAAATISGELPAEIEENE